MMTLLQTEAPVVPFFNAAGIVVAIITLTAIVVAYLGISKLIDVYKDVVDVIQFTNLQFLVSSLPVNADNYEKIEIEFSKVRSSEDGEEKILLLWDAFMQRFQKIAKIREESAKGMPSSFFSTRAMNEMKSIAKELETITRERQGAKGNMKELQALSQKETILIQNYDLLARIINVQPKLEKQEQAQKEPEGPVLKRRHKISSDVEQPVLL